MIKVDLNLQLVQETYLNERSFFSIDTSVSVDEAGLSQLISVSVEEDLLPLILAHCSYSLELAKGTQIQYDFKGLQTQITEKFIRGRQRLVTKVNQSFRISRES